MDSLDASGSLYSAGWDLRIEPDACAVVYVDPPTTELDGLSPLKYGSRVGRSQRDQNVTTV